ncbi:HAMP domain-containing sensor histidine kinase [Cellulomonas sp. ATA003]|nr:HAMP domain-containing sensor histidine kinase [Cellulomonas sp. ATA003]WNB85271.1 HAMP domain-containing sensor histidine kinase [Cellulomonas sp. ATA003]
MTPTSAAASARERVADRLRAVPLGARMVAILCTVLLLGLTATGVTAMTLLGRNLLAQVDAQLETYAQPLLDVASRPGGQDMWGQRRDATTLPSDYYIEVLAADGTSLGVLATADTTGAGTPDLQPRTAAQVAAGAQVPFTVPSAQGRTGWRAVLLPAVAQGEYVTVAVALPLTGVERTLDQMRTVLLVTGLAVIVLGSFAGWVAMRRSLRPLAQMEATAAAIAAGDLSRRVASEPPSTEVGRLGDALNTMLGHIERAFAERAESEERMRRFVSDASHELRTPLATIRGYSELYRMGAITSTDQMDDTVRRIEDSATRMGGLVEDLLHLARLDEGRPLRADPVDLTVLAADAVSDLHALDPGRPVRLVPLPGAADQGLAPCVVVGDEDRLRQVLANLTGNVVRHTAPGTPVEVRVGRVGDGAAVLEVSDQGPGIPPSRPPACSSGSTASTPPVPGSPAAVPGWGWRSSPRSWAPTTARCGSTPPPAAGPRSTSSSP